MTRPTIATITLLHVVGLLVGGLAVALLLAAVGIVLLLATIRVVLAVATLRVVVVVRVLPNSEESQHKSFALGAFARERGSHSEHTLMM
jgi:hypothetical protein